MKNRKVGILLAQTGTPDSPTPLGVAKYLGEFLSDPRMVELPRPVWLPLLWTVVLPLRSGRLARDYARIWNDDGMPLAHTSRRQANSLEKKLLESNAGVRVRLGMRYASPSLGSALDELLESGCSKILLLPLFPQYSACTWGAACDAVFKRLSHIRNIPSLRIAEPFFAHSAYLGAQALLINKSLATLSTPCERLLLSYHSLPKARISRGDPYLEHCRATSEALIPLLDIERERVITTFQSQMGFGGWLGPSTKDTLAKLRAEKVPSVAIAFPGFVADCLETLVEISSYEKAKFEASKSRLSVFECLNDLPAWTDALRDICLGEISSWL